MKRDPRKWEEICANDATDKGLISKICKQLMQLNREKKNQKMGRKSNGHFSKEDIQMTNIYMERCSTPPIIREIQIKTTMRYHLTTIRMDIIKEYAYNKCWGECGEKGPLLFHWWNAN